MNVGDKLMKMTIKEGAKEETAHGRLIGFINDEECKAIINTEDAPKKIFTSASAKLSDYVGKVIGSRFVFVTYELGGATFDRKIFISPIIKSISYIYGEPEYKCGEKKFFIEIHSGDKTGDKND